MKRTTARLRASRRPRVWLARHLQTALAALGRLWRHPVGSMLNLLVIAIALALPTGLHLLVDNLQRLTAGWQDTASATLFLRLNLDDRQVDTVLQRLRATPGVADLQHLTPEQALADFRAHSDLSGVLDLLDENPLPHVVILQGRGAAARGPGLAALLERLRHWPEVDRAVADLAWVERFQALLILLRRVGWLLGALFGLAVLLVIGNTIRLEIQSRQAEIEIVRLVGGSDAFVRRPFLWEGFWYGLLGGLGALMLVLAALWWLAPALDHLVRLYGSHFQLHGLEPTGTAIVVGGGAVLGVLGAAAAVRQAHA